MHWAAIGSQCKLMNSGVTCVLFGSLKINLAAAFWYLMLLTQIPESIIHNNSSSVKSVLFWIRREICTDAKNSSKLICVWFNVRDNNRCTYSLRKSYYGLVLELKCLNAGFVSAQDDNWWTVDYCDVFILTTLSSIAETHFYKPDEETNSSWSRMKWVWVSFQQCSFMDELTVPSSHFASEEDKIFAQKNKTKILSMSIIFAVYRDHLYQCM